MQDPPQTKLTALCDIKWIDRERGTAGVFIDELYPPADALTQQLFAGFQKAAYTLAGASA